MKRHQSISVQFMFWVYYLLFTRYILFSVVIDDHLSTSAARGVINRKWRCRLIARLWFPISVQWAYALLVLRASLWSYTVFLPIVGYYGMPISTAVAILNPEMILRVDGNSLLLVIHWKFRSNFYHFDVKRSFRHIENGRMTILAARGCTRKNSCQHLISLWYTLV